MATTQAQLFVPTAVERARSIKDQLIKLQSDAVSLKGEFTSLGGAAMPGYDIPELWAATIRRLRLLWDSAGSGGESERSTSRHCPAYQER